MLIVVGILTSLARDEYCRQEIILTEGLDIAIDIRKDSKAFGKVYKKILDSKKSIALFIPKGFMHGIISLKNETMVTTYCSKKYNPSKEFGIKLDSIPLKLPRLKLIFSKKDKKLPIYNEFIKKIK